MEKIVVTGHNGFLGSNLVEKLSSNYEVFGISKNLSQSNIIQIEKDVRKITVEDIPDNISCIIHLAAITDIIECQKNPSKCFDINVDGTKNMLEICNKSKSKFIFLSTSHVYGNPIKLPISEDHPQNPNSIYSESKLKAENLCKTYSESGDLDLSILRVFSVYGPKSPDHLVISRIISQILKKDLIKLGNLQSKRDFIFVSDVVNAIETCIKNINGFNVFNVGSEKSQSIAEICNFLKKISNKDFIMQSEKSKIRENDPMEIISDCTKLKKLNWKPEIDIQTGLQLTFDWFKRRINS